MSRRFSALCVVLMIAYMYGWSTRWTFNPVGTNGVATEYFFTAQGDSLLRGRLWVDEASIGPQTVNECWYVQGRCFGYFGLTPSLIRIPFLILFGATTFSFKVVMIPIAAGLAFGAALDLCQQTATSARTRSRSALFVCLAAVTLGPGSLLVLLADPFVYQEAILWSIAGVMLSVNFLWRWMRSGDTRLLVYSLVAAVFAAGSRPITVVVGLVFGCALLFKNRRCLNLSNDVAIIALGFVVLPALLSFGVIYAKFGQFSPPWNAYRNPSGIEQPPPTGPCNLKVEQGLKYIPSNLFAYTRPDAVRLSSEWPFVGFRFKWCTGPDKPTYLWPIKEGELYVERTTSVSNTMPIPLLGTLVAAFIAFRRRRQKELTILAALAASSLAATTIMTITTRYLGDFYPLLATGLAFSALPFTSVQPGRKSAFLGCMTLVLCSWSLVANASLITLYGWIF